MQAPAHSYLFWLFLLDKQDCKTAQALMLTTACSITFNTHSFHKQQFNFDKDIIFIFSFSLNFKHILNPCDVGWKRVSHKYFNILQNP